MKKKFSTSILYEFYDQNIEISHKSLRFYLNKCDRSSYPHLFQSNRISEPYDQEINFEKYK